jgi:hypothetical protein
MVIWDLKQTLFSFPQTNEMVDYTHPNAMNIPDKNKSLNHAEKRANHNAIERARRESLNIRFLGLAASLPTLQHVRKPSKAVIVSKSIEYIQETKQRLDVKSRSLQLIRQQNEELKREVNMLRQELGKAPVLFPDNIDMDLVFEANLEHQKELEQQEHRFVPSPISGSFRTGSPLDLLEEDDEDDKRSTFGSMSVHDDKRMSQISASFPISISQPAVSSPLSTYFPQIPSPIQFQQMPMSKPPMSSLSGSLNQMSMNSPIMTMNQGMHSGMNSMNPSALSRQMNQSNQGQLNHAQMNQAHLNHSQMTQAQMNQMVNQQTMNQINQNQIQRPMSTQPMHPQAIQIQNNGSFNNASGSFQNLSGSFHHTGSFQDISQSMPHPNMKYENMNYQFENEY